MIFIRGDGQSNISQFSASALGILALWPSQTYSDICLRRQALLYFIRKHCIFISFFYKIS